jgi:hypothetical protein
MLNRGIRWLRARGVLQRQDSLGRSARSDEFGSPDEQRGDLGRIRVPVWLRHALQIPNLQHSCK